MPEVEQGGSASQEDDDDSEPTFAPGKAVSAHDSSRSCSPCCPTEPECDALKHFLHTGGAWQQVTRVVDLCHTHVSHEWAVSSRHTPTSPTYTRDLARGPTRALVACAAHSCTLQSSTVKPAALPEYRACVHAVLGGLKLVDCKESPQNPEDSQKHNPDWLMSSLPAAVPIFLPLLLSPDAGRLWTCAQHPPTQQRPEGTQHKQLLIAKSHATDVEFQTFELKASSIAAWFWTADSRPHPAVTRTLQYAADIAACLNGHQRSAKSLQRRWKREIQRVLLRRRAAKTRAVLPHTSARAEMLLASFIDGVSSHWVRAPLLDGGDDNEDADAGTDSTKPDDDSGYIASFTSQQTTAIQS